MTRILHTPGPWFVQKSDHPGGLLIKPIPGLVVAQCDELPEMEANASLIASAPELLDTVLDIKRIVGKSRDEVTDPYALLDLIADRVRKTLISTPLKRS